MTTGRTSGQNCSHTPVKSYIGTSVGMSRPLNKAVNDVEFGRFKGGMSYIRNIIDHFYEYTYYNKLTIVNEHDKHHET